MTTPAVGYWQGHKGRVSPPALPAGAELLEAPIKQKIAGWVEATHDAKIDIDGITWWRVEGGFGDGQRTGWHPRDDWQADLPGMQLSVGRYFDAPWEGGSMQALARQRVLDNRQYAAVLVSERSVALKAAVDTHTILVMSALRRLDNVV